MINIIAFFLTLGQLALLTAAYYVPMEDVFALLAVHFSPITIFFSLLDHALEFNGDISYWLWVGLVYCLVKYFIISRAIVSDGVGFWDVSAMLLEAAYLAGTTFYVVNNSYL